MKKLIALLMAAVMAISLAGCITTDTNSSKGAAAESSAEASKAESSKAESSKPAESSKAEESKTAESSKEEESSKAEESKAESSKAEESSKAAESSMSADSSKVEPAVDIKGGTYYLVGMYENDEMMGTDMIQIMSAFGVSGELVMNADGTGTITIFGEVTEMTWDDETITVNDSPAKYTIEDVFLTIFTEEESTQLIFSTMTPEELTAAGKAIVGTGQYAPAEPNQGAEGDGQVYHLVAMQTLDQTVGTDQMMMLDALGMSSFIQLNSDGTGTLSLYGQAAEISWHDNVILFDESEIVFEQTEETLILSEDDAYLLFSVKTAKELEEAGEGIASVDNTVPEDPPVITIAGADWIDNPEEEGQKILMIWLDVENPGTEPFTPGWESDITVTQDGNIIDEDWYFFDDDELNALDDASGRGIMPGGKNRVAFFFEADQEGGMMQVKVVDWFEENVLVEEQLDPKNLPGAPAEPFVLEKVTEYPELEGIPTAGTIDGDYEIEILEISFIEPEYEFEEKKFQVVLEFRNNSKETAAFWSEVEYTASQDRIELQGGNEENAFEDVAAGEKITVTLEWEVFSDSPIALVISDSRGEDQIGGVYPVE